MDQHSDRLTSAEEQLNKRTASDMLEDALHHFDNIIDKTDNHQAIATEFNSGVEGVALLMEDLRNAVEATVDAETEDDHGRIAFSDALLRFLSAETLSFYRNLLKLQIKDNNAFDVANHLQSENDSLALQVSVLSDQIELQTEKLKEVEMNLKEALERLEGADTRLQEEVAAKTNLETQRLQLLNEISNCKITIAQYQQQKEVDLANIEKVKSDKIVLENQYKKIVESLQSLTEEKANIVPSSDEGIISNPINRDQHLSQLCMPGPCATSTPVSIDHASNEHKKSIYTNKKVMSAQSSNDTAQNNISKSSDQLNSTQLSQQANMLSSQAESCTKTKSEPLCQAASQKSSSTPNLAMTETPSLRPSKEIHSPDNLETPPFHHRKKHGFRKFFTSFKLRRSRSTTIEVHDNKGETSETEKFSRGGVRATAGPRLSKISTDQCNKAESSSLRHPPEDIQFQQWDAARVCQWLIDIGLPGYVDSCRKWVKSGDTLLRATNHELEKELGMRNAFHKKKLMLHLQASAGGEDEDGVGTFQMNSTWVARWLDDIGLPQYKDSFNEACVDGLMLHHLTISDTHKLKITNLFHLTSLRWGLEKLRVCQFDPSQLKRRPVTDGGDDDVSLWTNHRVMEWLRSADLAEYAPNLRGSGVHGALMVHEPRFTAETLATLLNIPTNKSLLRRHLAAKLEELLLETSAELQRLEAKDSYHQPINITAKYKVGRRSFGSFGRFRSGSGASTREFSPNEYVCPMSNLKALSQPGSALDSRKQLSEPNETPVSEFNEEAAREIHAYSNEIKSLTNKWSES